MIVLGIDPGTKTGVARFTNGVLTHLETVDQPKVRDLIRYMHVPGAIEIGLVVFEDSRKTSPVFSRAVSPAAMRKIARNVGMVDAYCKDIEDVCKELNIPCRAVSPKGKGAKVKAQRFEELTGWTKQCSQHARDAAMVAWPYRSEV
jgi:hypothetical protein